MTSKEILISFHRKKIKGVCHFLKLIFLILLHIRISSMWVVSHLFLGQKLKFNMNLMANWKTFQILFLSSKTCRNLSFWHKMSRQANRHTYYICNLSNVSYIMEFLAWWVLKNQGFYSNINCIQMKLLYFVNWHGDRASKSGKIVLSKIKQIKKE